MKRRTKLVLLFTVAMLCVSFLAFAGGEKEKADEGDEGIELIWMPKLLGIDYFNSCRDGAEEAAAELGINLKEDAPVEADVTKQVELIDNYITQQVDIIAVAANDPQAIAPIMKKAADAGIKTVTWDADANERMIFVNQTSYELFGHGFPKLIAKYVGEDAKIGIVTSGSPPGLMRKYVKDGSCDPFLLWNTVDLGYLSVYAAKALYDGEFVMGPPFEFNEDNIDDFDF